MFQDICGSCGIFPPARGRKRFACAVFFGGFVHGPFSSSKCGVTASKAELDSVCGCCTRWARRLSGPALLVVSSLVLEARPYRVVSDRAIEIVVTRVVSFAASGAKLVLISG